MIGPERLERHAGIWRPDGKVAGRARSGMLSERGLSLVVSAGVRESIGCAPTHSAGGSVFPAGSPAGLDAVRS